MSKKKAPKGVFHGLASGSFAQKKKVVLGNVKHSGDEKDISLSKSGPGNSVYSDVDSMFSDDENVGMTGINERFLLGSIATILKAKCVNTGTIFGSLLGSPNFTMDDDKIVLSSHLLISLEKKWINPKIIKTSVEVSIKKSFALDINLLAVKDSMHMAKTVGDRDIWASRNCFKALLFTLPVRTTAHDLGTLLDRVGERSCIINRLFETGNRVCCAVVGFKSEGDLDFAFHTEPIFGHVRLSWARLDLVKCEECGCFGHLTLECDASDASTPKPSLYTKKNVPISRLAAFGGKSWAQVVSDVLSSGHPLFDSGLGSGSFPFGVFGLGGAAPLSSVDISFLEEHLASLKHSLELLADQVSGIVKRLSFVELVPLVPSSLGSPIAAAAFKNSMLDLDMALNSASVLSASCLSLVVDGAHNLSSSSSKVLTSKVGGLETKLASLKASIETKLHSSVGSWIANKFEGVQVFAFGLEKGFLGAGMTVIVNNSLACHVFKVEEVPGRLISVWLLFKSKLLVILLGLYASASAEAHFCQAVEVNSLIAKAVNSSTFVILGGDFNENSSSRSASFRFYLKLGLVNAFTNHQLVGAFTWSNSRGAKKTIDYVFVSRTLASALANYSSAMLLVATDEFSSALVLGNIDAAWSILKEVMIASADEIFSRCWFSEF
ncbi:hypothetical protein G9A89_007141 [Geosiphon pyriformis]|nr:hypothetical protein G9A89_007141 [Geosiphon pyriformis]